MTILKKSLIFVIGLGLVGGAFWWWQKANLTKQQLVSTPAKVIHAVTHEHVADFKMSTPELSDSKEKFITAPKTYATAPEYYGQHTFETTPNQIKTDAGNQSFAFKTTIFLPVTWKHSGDFGNLQALSMPSGRYAYVLLKTSVNYGRIVRFDVPAMQYYQRVMGWRAYRYATYMAMIGKASPLQKTMLQTTIKRGPVFKTGHGQSLSYNPTDQHFYLWQDTQVKTEQGWDFPNSPDSTIIKIDQTSLAPTKEYHDPVQVDGYTVPGGHVLTNDGHGNWYFYTYGTRDHDVKIYRGRIRQGHFTWKLVQKIAQQPGTHVQSMAYNSVNQRLYIVADDAIVSFPAKQLGRLRPGMMRYSYFSSHREFEGLAFHGDQANLLLIRGSEIMQSAF